MKPVIIISILLLLVGLTIGVYFYFKKSSVDCSKKDGSSLRISKFKSDSNGNCIPDKCVSKYGDSNGKPLNKTVNGDEITCQFYIDCSKQPKSETFFIDSWKTVSDSTGNNCIADICKKGYGKNGKPLNKTPFGDSETCPLPTK